ncbi:DUF6380 family protein [Streptomyces viridochromogenes]|uniref:DUF6380 family protein n=1 Tax=Streptomyces viridochromogenes TaxID=1938 RepID=UPI003CC7DE43
MTHGGVLPCDWRFCRAAEYSFVPARSRERVAVGGASCPGAARDKRRATLRRAVASLTEMVGRASCEPHGRRAGEGAR